MKHRKLRIAWSVAWGIAAVLVIALWVRSYWQWDHLVYGSSEYVFFSWSRSGAVEFAKIDRAKSKGDLLYGWKIKAITSPSQGILPVGGNDLMYGGFSFERMSDGVALSSPHWFLALISTVCATLSWLPWWSRRFTLRTLLAAIALVAVGLGLAVYW